MLILIWLVLCLAAASIILLPLVLWRQEIYRQYSGSRLVACPQDQQPAAVTIDLHHALSTAIDGPPDLRLCDCTRWPERANCDRACLSSAAAIEPYPDGKAKAGEKQIYHLPILLAAFVAWCLGAIWHSQYLFRARWMGAVGLTQAQVKQMVWWLSPHLLTAGACLLFAYGVAGILAVRHRRGALQGILMATLLCGALVATSWYSMAKLPHDLLLIEAGYGFLAALTMGAIVGGLFNRLVLPVK